jgi:hypothetical protein
MERRGGDCNVCWEELLVSELELRVWDEPQPELMNAMERANNSSNTMNPIENEQPKKIEVQEDEERFLCQPMMSKEGWDGRAKR